MPGKEIIKSLTLFIEENNDKLENEINFEIHAINKSNDINDMKEISKKESIKLIIENDESFSNKNDSNKNDNSDNNFIYNNNINSNISNNNNNNNNYDLGEYSLHDYIKNNNLSNNIN